VERLSSNSEREASSPSGSGLSQFGKVVPATLRIDLHAMFDKSNYVAFLSQLHMSLVDKWTGVPIVYEEAFTGEFAAIICYDGNEYVTNLAYDGMFSDVFGGANVLLSPGRLEPAENGYTELWSEINEGSRLFFLICGLNPQQPEKSIIVPYMAILTDSTCNRLRGSATEIAYTMLHHAYLGTLL
jgi:hypothetical protein